MSIYFQYPAIEEYPVVINPLQNDEKVYPVKEEMILQIKADENEQLKNYLTLKTV